MQAGESLQLGVVAKSRIPKGQIISHLIGFLSQPGPNDDYSTGGRRPLFGPMRFLNDCCCRDDCEACKDGPNVVVRAL